MPDFSMETFTDSMIADKTFLMAAMKITLSQEKHMDFRRMLLEES